MGQSKDPAYKPPLTLDLLAPRHWPTWLGMALFRLLTAMPWRMRAALGAAAGALIYRFHAWRRHIVNTNFALCFPERSEAERAAMARRYFRYLAQCSLDYGALWWSSEQQLQRLITIHGGEHLTQCREQGRGVILLTAHGVALDFGAAAITQHYDSVGLIKPANNPVVEWLMTRGRTRFRGRLHLRDEGIRPVIRDIREGYAFYYLPDEDLSHVKGSDWTFAPFFNIPTATITALGRLAKLSNAAVLPCMTYYLPEEGRYEVRIDPPLTDFPSGDAVVDTARMNAELERMIRVQPEQYMWSLRLFKTRPEGEENPYGKRKKKRKKR